MARPRKYVRDPRTNKTVHGLSCNKSTHEHYSINPAGDRVYWGRDRVAAVDRFRASYSPAPFERISDDTAYAELLDRGIPQAVVDENPELIELAKRGSVQVSSEYMERNPDAFVTRFVKNTRRAAKGLPPLPRPRGQAQEDPVPPTKKRLRDCLKTWREWKEADACSPDYIADVERCFDRFIGVVGNRLVGDLTADDFVRWDKWVLKESQSRETPKWYNDQHKNVRAVLRLAKRKNPTWTFPAGLLERITQYDAKRYIPKEENRDPLPPDVFRAILAVAEKWAVVKPTRFSPKTQRGRAKRLHAQRKRREGVQFAALLRLAANAALDNIDCVRLPPQGLKLDADLPYMDFARIKSRRQVGQAIPRRTPLLPETVTALRRWRSFERVAGPTVFRNVRRNVYTSSDLNVTFQRLLKAAKITEPWTFKHIRNVGSNVGYKNGISSYLIDALLGHVIPTTTRHYISDVEPHDLLPLVKLIGDAYFPEHQTPTAQVPARAAG